MIIRIDKQNTSYLNRVEKMFPNYFQPNRLKETLKNNEFRSVYVLEDNNQIIGVLIIDKIYERMEIIEIEIIKEKRRQGYGNILLNFLTNLAEDEKVENITLEVKETNIPAINLYKKHGFMEVAIRKNYYQGTDGILMERKMM